MSTEHEPMTLEQALDWLITMKDRGLLRDGIDDHDANAIILSISAHLAREKAEPVAWRYELPVGNWQYFDGPIDDDNLDACKQCGLTAQNLYTRPTAPAEAEIERLRAGYVRLRDASDIEMADGDLARHIAREMLR